MIGKIGFMFAARFLFGVQQWAMVAILARTADAAAVGVLGYGLAILVPLAGFFGLGMRQGIATDLDGQFSFRDYLTMRVALIAAMVGAAFLTFFLLVDDPVARAAALLLLVPKGIELMSEMAYGVFQRHGRLAAISMSLILRAVVGLCGFWAGLQLGGDLVGAVLGWGLAWIAVYALYDAPRMARCLTAEATAPKGAPKGALTGALTGPMGRMMVVQAPLGVSALVGNLGISAPRLLLEPVVTLETLGIFTAVFMIFQAANTLAVAVLQLFMTPLARAMRGAALRRLVRLVGGATALVLVGLAAMWALFLLAGSETLGLMYGPDYAAHGTLLLQLAAGWSAAYLSIIFRYMVTATRSFRTGLAIDFSAALLIGLGCVLALRLWPGAPMAAIAIGFAAGQWLRFGLTVIIALRCVRMQAAQAALGPSEERPE